ncbi:MAG TPA: hypothetical protein VM369_09015 [Candidatus Binatia bacterium]|nr:hypothetical protein [Candidatus Binatia bacterium]
MSEEHPFLARVRAAIAATGWHTEHWGALRREVFPGAAAWSLLQQWCMANVIVCELTFGESSKSACVQFRRAGTTRLPVAPPAGA